MTQDKTTNVRNFRKLEDLNLIDNFLFQQMLSQEDGEEFARILLSTILGRQIRKVKIVPQKNILGKDTDKHGIRMDAYIQEVWDEQNSNVTDINLVSNIYDIEPTKPMKKYLFPSVCAIITVLLTRISYLPAPVINLYQMLSPSSSFPMTLLTKTEWYTPSVTAAWKIPP